MVDIRYVITNVSIVYTRPKKGYHPSQDETTQRHAYHVKNDNQKGQDIREEEDQPLEVRVNHPCYPDYNRIYYTGYFFDECLTHENSKTNYSHYLRRLRGQLKQFNHYTRQKNDQLGYIIIGLLKSRDDIRIPKVRIVNSSKEDNSREKGLKLAKWLV